MPLSPAQRILYWAGKRHGWRSHVEHVGPWHAFCDALGLDPKDAEARYDLHERLGLPRSTSDWGNRDLNRFLGEAEVAWAQYTGSRSGPRRDRDRENVLHTIRSLGHDEAYIRALSTDLYGLACYDELALDDLERLRNTLTSRARAKRRK